jgi:stress-induced morphogen
LRAPVLVPLIVHSAQGIDIAFARKSRVEVHRAVSATLADAFAKGLHALAIEARVG